VTRSRMELSGVARGNCDVIESMRTIITSSDWCPARKAASGCTTSTYVAGVTRM